VIVAFVHYVARTSRMNFVRSQGHGVRANTGYGGANVQISNNCGYTALASVFEFSSRDL
jgi:hypothetical protein